MLDALERYCRVFHPEIDAVLILPIDAARATADATDNTMLKMFAELMAYFEEVGELGDPADANALLGAPTVTLNAWIESKRSDGGTHHARVAD